MAGRVAIPGVPIVEVRGRYLTVLTSTVRTATTSSGLFSSFSCRGLHLLVDVTCLGEAACMGGVVSTGIVSSLTVFIEGYDSVTGEYYTVLEGTAIASLGTTILKVYPGIGTIAGGAANDILPGSWRVRVVHGSVGSAIYSVTAQLVP